MKRLLLFRTFEELTKLKQLFNLSGSTDILLALTPEADYAAEKNKLDYKTIEDFYSDPELMDLGVRNFAKVRDFCVRLDDYLLQALKNIPEAKEVISTHDDFFDFNHCYDALLHRTLTLISAIIKITPELTVYFRYPSFRRNIKDDIENNLLTSRILPVIANTIGIKTAVLSCHKTTEHLYLHSLVKAFKYRLSNLMLEFPKSEMLVSKLKKLYKGLFLNKEDKKTLGYISSFDKNSITLIGDKNSPFDDGHVVRKWIDSRTGNFFTLGQIMKIGECSSREEICHLNAIAREACVIAWEQIDCSTIKDFFQIAEVDVYPLVRSFLREYIYHTIPARIVAVRKLRIGLRRIKKGAVIAPFVPEWIANIAKQKGIPTIAFQHGGAFGYLDYPMAEHEFSGTGYFFCYGKGVSDFYKAPSPNAYLQPGAPRPVPIPVGSPSLDIFKQREQIVKPRTPKDGNNKTVVYVTTNLGGDRRYFNYHMYPDIWFWRLQRSVIEICTKYRNIQLIVKLYPRKGIRKDLIHNPIIDWLKDVSLPNCHALENDPFTDLLSIGDLFIIDQPFTTLLQALTTRKKIIVYADKTYLRFDPNAAELLRKRVVLSETKTQFLEDLEAVLSEDDWTLPEPVNDEFLKAYGTYLDDGKSVERAIKMILNIIKQKEVENEKS